MNQNDEFDQFLANVKAKMEKLKAQGDVKDFKIENLSDKIEVIFLPARAKAARVVKIKYER